MTKVTREEYHVGGASRGDCVQEKVRPGTGREAGLDHVRRDCFRFAPSLKNRRETRLPQYHHRPTYPILLF